MTLRSPLGAPKLHQLNVTWGAGQTLSDALTLQGGTPVRLFIPATWTAADLYLEVSPDAGATWYRVIDPVEATDVTLKAVAGKATPLAPSDLPSLDYIRFVSSVAQVAARVAVLAYRAFE